MNKELTASADNTTEHIIVPEISPNTSHHAQNIIMNDKNDDNLNTFDVTKLQVTVLLTDVKKNNETKKQFVIRLENFLFDRFDFLLK